MAVTLEGKPFLYRYDQGPLGDFSNSEAIILIEDVINEWRSVKTASLVFQRDNPGFLDFDVNGSNFDPVVNRKVLFGHTTIIFDHDGVISASFTQLKSVTGAPAGLTIRLFPLGENRIAESVIVLNGNVINDNAEFLRRFAVHEIGHALGLDHTQSRSVPRPVMYAETVRALLTSSLQLDDKSSLSLLYPNHSELINFGKIEGKVYREDGVTPVFGANVIAKNLDNPTTEITSCVSDYLGNMTGSYTLFALPPGRYQVEVEPIDSMLVFDTKATIGPYTTSEKDKSFRNPVIKGFYIGPKQPTASDESQALVLNVSGGESIENSDIIVMSSFLSTPSEAVITLSNVPPSTKELAIEVDFDSSVLELGSVATSDVPGAKVSVISEGINFPFISPYVSIDNGGQDLPSSFTVKIRFVGVNNGTSVLSLRSVRSFLTNFGQLLPVTTLVDFSSVLVVSGENQPQLPTPSPQPTSGPEIQPTPTTEPTTTPEPTPEPEFPDQPNNIPTLKLEGQDLLTVRSVKTNKIFLKVTAKNFTSASKCIISQSGNFNLRFKPRIFSLSPANSKKTIIVSLSRLDALNIIRNKVEETLDLNVNCNNGAKGLKELTISFAF